MESSCYRDDVRHFLLPMSLITSLKTNCTFCCLFQQVTASIGNAHMFADGLGYRQQILTRKCEIGVALLPHLT